MKIFHNSRVSQELGEEELLQTGGFVELELNRKQTGRRFRSSWRTRPEISSGQKRGPFFFRKTGRKRFLSMKSQ